MYVHHHVQCAFAGVFGWFALQVWSVGVTSSYCMGQDYHNRNAKQYIFMEKSMYCEQK